MFEKEVEERFIKNYPEFCCNGKPLSPYWDLWQDGAEFGYNKVNEWHDLEKNPNDLPKENHFVFICNARFGYSVARYAPFNEYYCKIWVTNDNMNILPEEVFAWCEIPKFEG